MKDFIINVAATQNEKGKASFAAQAEGTLSERPMFAKAYKKISASEASLIGALECIEEIKGYLSNGDTIDIRFDLDGGNCAQLIAKGSAHRGVNETLRQTVRSLMEKGVSVALNCAPSIPKGLTMKAQMSLAMTG